jgi:glycerol transport system ATP-binding protein
VQTGTPIELFERPQHTFVGHFIGSPGMNVLPCEVKGGKAFFAGRPVATGNAAQSRGNATRLELGVRPEFVTLAKKGIPADIVKVADAGRYRIVEARSNGHAIKLLVPEGDSVPEGRANLAFDPRYTQVYEDGWMAGARP